MAKMAFMKYQKLANKNKLNKNKTKTSYAIEIAENLLVR
jgi:hypothetical protein